VSLLVVGLAKPHDIERPAVIGVVGYWLQAAFRHGADWPRHQAAISHSVANGNLRCAPDWVGGSPLGRNLAVMFFSRWILGTLLFVGEYLFSNGTMMPGMHIRLRAIFAFIQMTISHLRVLVEVCKRLFNAALKARFHDELS
jgi:hypothetical protein